MRTRSRLVVAGLVLIVGGMVLTGCGDDDDDGAGGSTTSSTAATSASTSGTTSSTTTVQDRWVGVVWVPSAVDHVGDPTIFGKHLGFTSVVGMCQGEGCPYGLDLLTEMSVTEAPPAGDYLLWSSRKVRMTDDGRPVWEVVDVREVTLDSGTTTILCAPEGDPTGSALGIVGTADLPEGGTVTPDEVYEAADDGTIATPDPAGYQCEVGQD